MLTKGTSGFVYMSGGCLYSFYLSGNGCNSRRPSIADYGGRSQLNIRPFRNPHRFPGKRRSHGTGHSEYINSPIGQCDFDAELYSDLLTSRSHYVPISSQNERLPRHQSSPHPGGTPDSRPRPAQDSGVIYLIVLITLWRGPNDGISYNQSEASIVSTGRNHR